MTRLDTDISPSSPTASNGLKFPFPLQALVAPLLLALMVLLWGLSWPATAVILKSLSPLWLATARFGSAAVCLFVFVGLTGKLRRPAKQDLPIVISVGLLQMLAFTGLGMIAMTFTDTSRAALLAYTTPLWALITGTILLRRKPSLGQLIALLVGLSGIALICSPLEMDWSAPGALAGSGMLIIGAIAYSVALVHIGHHRWHGSPLQIAPWQMLLATIGLAGLALVFEGPVDLSHVNLTTVELLFFTGPIATSACFVTALHYGRRISSFAMSNLTLGVPVIGVLSTIFLLGARPSALLISSYLSTTHR